MSIELFEPEVLTRSGYIIEQCELAILSIPHLPLDEQVEVINSIRKMLHDAGPFGTEPVDLVEWVKADVVHANDYNPNSVAPPEMELLRLSIMADGYTQPIVTYPEDGKRTVIDGFHRNRVGKECKDVRERVKGYLPVVRSIHGHQEGARMNQGVYVILRDKMATQDERYGAFASTHEAMGVLLEEWTELQEAVRANDIEAVQRECLDLAAPLMRLYEQLFEGARLRRRSIK